jgi:hypothetical protein
MILGLSFGKKKTSIDQTTDINKNESVTGSQSQATTGFQQGTSSTTSTGTSSQSGTQTTTGQSNQAQTDRGTQQQTGTTTTLGADVIAGLADRVKSVLAGGVTDANIANLANQIAGTGNFDPNSFVSGIVGQARTRGEQQLQETNAARESVIGGTAATNSMAALLAARGRNDLDANLAGIEAQARAQAEGIRNQNLQAGVAAQGGLADIASNLGNVLKGGEVATDMQTLTDQISQLIGTQTGTQTSATTGTTSETQNTVTSQLIAELVNALTNQNVATTGTEHTTGKTKQGGGGVSLSL